ncbi:hypothetical protein [Inquilinus limosus]|nr:hypothetical protein [Inquilinus limosus]
MVNFGDGRQAFTSNAGCDKSPDSIITVYSDHALTASDFVL